MMFILIIDKFSAHPMNLVDVLDYKGIHIYVKNDNYYINLDKDYLLLDNSKFAKLDCRPYEIKNEKECTSIYLYVYENSNQYEEYDLYENVDFLISHNTKSNIVSLDEYSRNSYLLCKDGQLKSNYLNLSVNSKQYTLTKLKDGDIIEYYGHRIIYFNDFLYINKFKTEIKINKYKYEEHKIVYKNLERKIEYYRPEQLNELLIEPLLEYKESKKNKEPLIKQLLPSIVMSISMCAIAGLNFYNSLYSNQSILQRIVYLIMPLSMIMTGIIVPIIINHIDNKKERKEIANHKKEYLQYLDEYKNDLEENITNYVSKANEHYFDVHACYKKMFYATKVSEDYLKISVGKYTTNKEIEILFCEDKDINNKLNEIKDIVNNIKNYPLFLDLNKNKIVTFVSRPGFKNYLFKRVLLELSFKHHYDDIYIAIYAHDSSIYEDCYNLPHLFKDDRRLTLSSKRQLQLLDQTVFDRPIILLIYDDVTYNFTNQNIHVIYFSCDNRDLYKNSETVIEYYNNYGYLYTNYKLRFEYFEEEINYNNAFSYLGRINNIFENEKINSFKDIFNASIKENYLINASGLRADFAYINNELLSFDLHESKQGPHGLIGGATGSGKSELIVSLLLSLCIRYSPEYLNIVLIDYKGGGIKDSLTYNGQVIPHIVGDVSNLENNVFERLIICLASECKYRQELFKKLSNIIQKSIVNIDDYLENYTNSSLEKLSHLLIVVDELAELKKEESSSFKELISLSRIGRSLGVHLILATQKPAGVVDDEIWSNSRFKIALKVFEEKDSMDLLKSKDAINIYNPGEFYLKVDDSLLKARSIYAKKDINDNDPYKISLLNIDLSTMSEYKENKSMVISEASYYCKQIIDTSKEMNLKTRNLIFMPPISKYRKEYIDGAFVFGEVDDYYNNKRYPLIYDLMENILIYSSRKKEIYSILNALNENNRKYIVISNERINDNPNSIVYENEDDIRFVFNMLLKQNIELTLIIEDINCFISYEEDYLDLLYKIIRRKDNASYNLILLSSNSQINIKILNSFKNKLMINIVDNSDLTNFYGLRSNYKGSSYFYKDELISFVPIKLEEYCNVPIKYELVKRIPSIIYANIKNNKCLLGYDIKNKQEVYYEGKLLITSFDDEILELYDNSYKGIFEIVSYNNTLYKKEYKNILWLKDGIFEQRLFISGLKLDLKEDEGLLIRNNKKTIIKVINHV